MWSVMKILPFFLCVFLLSFLLIGKSGAGVVVAQSHPCHHQQLQAEKIVAHNHAQHQGCEKNHDCCSILFLALEPFKRVAPAGLRHYVIPQAFDVNHASSGVFRPPRSDFV